MIDLKDYIRKLVTYKIKLQLLIVKLNSMHENNFGKWKISKKKIYFKIQSTCYGFN